jgi:hypothetical protein
MITSASKLTSLQHDSVGDCLSFGVESRAESVAMHSRGKSPRGPAMAADKSLAEDKKSFAGKDLFAPGASAIE